MDIPAMSIAMNQSKLLQQVSLANVKNIMKLEETMAAGIINAIEQSNPTPSVSGTFSARA